MDLVRGAVDPRGGYISKILHVKMKESGPIGGACAGRAPPRSANAYNSFDDLNSAIDNAKTTIQAYVECLG